MKTLIITEKPDMSEKFSEALKDRTKNMKKQFDGKIRYFESDDYVITNAVGHVYRSKDPKQYEGIFGGWKWSAIPFYPPGGNLDFEPGKDKKDIVSFLKKQFKRNDISAVINACDAGREGDLIFWEIYDQNKSKFEVKRWWASSLTKKAILDAFDNLRDSKFFMPRKDEGYARQFADWAFGHNITVALTIKARIPKTVLHGGRVKTPVLKILVDRKREIENFVPQKYFEIEADFGNKYKGQWFKGELGNTKLSTKEEADKIASLVKGKIGKVISKEVKEDPEYPKPLYSLTDLSYDANKKFGYAADKTLQIAQQLYEAFEVISYPRSSSNHLGTDMIPELKGILEGLDTYDYAPFAREIIAKGIKTSTRFVDDSKLSDHHAIIPTNKRVDFSDFKKGKGVTAQELQNIYDLVAKRFLAVFYPPAKYEKTSIVTEVEKETFKTNGKIMMDPGWKVVYGKDVVEDVEEDEKEGKKAKGKEKEKEAILPPIDEGEENEVKDSEAKGKETKAPTHYDDGELIKMMKNPRAMSKLIEDEALSNIMKNKEEGIGTEATRSGIIKELKAKGYIAEEGKTKKKYLVATPLAEQVVDLAPEEIRSPIITADWEQKLVMIQEEKMTRKQFEEDIRKFVLESIEKIKNSNVEIKVKSVNEAQETEYTCLKCKGKMVKVKYQDLDYYICENHKKESPCMRLYEKTLNKTLTKKQIHELLTNGETKDKVPKLKNQSGKVYEARIKMDMEALRALPIIENDGKPRSQATEVKCPFCEGKIEENSKAFGCDSYKQKKSCGFTVWKNNSEKLNIIQIQKLIDENKTDVIDDMKGPKGKYSAYYELDVKNKKIERKYAN